MTDKPSLPDEISLEAALPEIGAEAEEALRKEKKKAEILSLLLSLFDNNMDRREIPVAAEILSHFLPLLDENHALDYSDMLVIVDGENRVYADNAMRWAQMTRESHSNIPTNNHIPDLTEIFGDENDISWIMPSEEQLEAFQPLAASIVENLILQNRSPLLTDETRLFTINGINSRVEFNVSQDEASTDNKPILQEAVLAKTGNNAILARICMDMLVTRLIGLKPSSASDEHKDRCYIDLSPVNRPDRNSIRSILGPDADLTTAVPTPEQTVAFTDLARSMVQELLDANDTLCTRLNEGIPVVTNVWWPSEILRQVRTFRGNPHLNQIYWDIFDQAIENTYVPVGKLFLLTPWHSSRRPEIKPDTCALIARSIIAEIEKPASPDHSIVPFPVEIHTYGQMIEPLVAAIDGLVPISD